MAAVYGATGAVPSPGLAVGARYLEPGIHDDMPVSPLEPAQRGRWSFPARLGVGAAVALAGVAALSSASGVANGGGAIGSASTMGRAVDRMSLEAMDDDYAPTSDFSDFSVGSVCDSFSVATIDNTTWSYKYDAATSLPLIVIAINADDSSLMSMITSSASIDNFLTGSPTETNYLFVAYNHSNGVEAVQKLQVRMWKRMKAIGLDGDQIKAWFERVAFSSETMEELESAGSVLPKILRQGSWRSPFAAMSVASATDADGNELALESMTDDVSALQRISRVDCEIGWAARPENGATVTLSYFGDGCKPASDEMKQADLSDSYMLVTAPASQCTYAQAAANVMAQTSAAGVVMVYSKGDDVESMGGETTTNSAGQSAAVTAVSYVDGSALISLFEKNEGSLASLTIEMSSEMVPGYFMGIDSDRKLYQLGYWWTYSLQYVTLEARYLTYLSTVYEREAKSGYVVPVLDNVPLKNDHPASAHIIDLPSEKIMRDFQTLELDMKLTCEGNLDQECDKWDHVITLGASCNITDDSSTFTYDFYTGDTEGRRLSEDGGFKNEIGRWVTPFRREVGHWLTDVTPLMPMLYKNENGCNFTMEIISGSWVTSLELRWTDSISDDTVLTPASVSPLQFANRYYHDSFDSYVQYNANRTSNIETPEDAPGKVVLEAIISGHGDCEFEPTAHFWEVNGNEYNVTYFGAGTAYGCQDQAVEGSEPNEHGTNWYGRDGWCDGAPVTPHYFDVTDSWDVKAGAENLVRYFAKSYAADDDERFTESQYHVYDKPSVETDGCQGYILMSSNIVFYD